MRGKYKFSTVMMGIFIIVISLFLGLLVTMISYVSKSSNESEQNAVYEEVVRYEKSQLESETEEIMAYIKLSEAKASESMRIELKRRVDEAYLLADQIYEVYESELPINEIENKIIESLRELRFGEEANYVFMDRFNGEVMLYPILPESEGNNVLDLKDDFGNFVIRDEIYIAKNYDSGYAEGHWMKPNQEGDSSGTLKVSYIKRFRNFDFYIGTGIYEDTYIEKMKKDVLNDLQTFKMKQSGDQNYFISTSEGLLLIKDSMLTEGHEYISEAIMILAEQSPQGDYLQEERVNAGEESVSLTYVKPYTSWNWIVGYESQLNENVSASQAYHQEVVVDQHKKITFIIAAFVLLVFSGIMIFFNKRLSICFKNLENIMVTGTREDENGHLCFKEFEEIVEKIQLSNNKKTQSRTFMGGITESEQKPVATIVEGESVTTGLIQTVYEIVESGNVDSITAYKLKQIGLGLTSIRKLFMRLSHAEENTQDSSAALNLEHFSLKEHLVHVMDLVMQEFDEYSIETHVICDKDLIVYSDPIIMTQIITHLATNSVGHGFETGAAGLITIEVIYDDDYLRIYFSDNGRGMTQLIQERIFEPYYTTTAMKGDSGLGLTDVYNLVNNQLEGAINCSSRVGFGTDFFIDIPGVGPGLWFNIETDRENSEEKSS